MTRHHAWRALESVARVVALYCLVIFGAVVLLGLANRALHFLPRPF